MRQISQSKRFSLKFILSFKIPKQAKYLPTFAYIEELILTVPWTLERIQDIGHMFLKIVPQQLWLIKTTIPIF